LLIEESQKWFKNLGYLDKTLSRSFHILLLCLSIVIYFFTEADTIEEDRIKKEEADETEPDEVPIIFNKI
jgi:hypothetical protein